MPTSEFVVAGILLLLAGDLGVSVAQAGSLITVFAIGMVVGAPLVARFVSALACGGVVVFDKQAGEICRDGSWRCRWDGG